MSKLKLERHFNADADAVFSYITQRGHLLKWWGPEGMSLPEAQLDFSRTGPWSSVMMSADGKRYKVTGTVVAVDPPRAVEFTWAWHDEHDARGHESRVRFEVRPDKAGGSHFTLIHSGLADDESARNHASGWNSSLVKLERLAN